MASNNNEMLIDAQEVDGGIKYRYYKWEKMTNEEGLKVLEDHLERVKNGSCEGRPNVRNKIVPYTEWFCCDDWEDIKSYDDILKDKKNKFWRLIGYLKNEPYYNGNIFESANIAEQLNKNDTKYNGIISWGLRWGWIDEDYSA